MPQPLEEVLANIPQEGVEEPNLEVEEKETPTDSPAVEEPVVVEKPSQEGEHIPGEEEGYNKKTEKRIQQLLQDRKEERERYEALEQRLAAQEAQRNTDEEPIPESFAKLFGEDAEAYKEYKVMTTAEKSAWKAEVIAELKAEAEAETNEQEQYAQAYEEAMDDLEEEGKTFDRNELLKAMADRPIFRQDGQPDFGTVLELLESKKKADPAKVQARKNLAAVNKQGGAVKTWKTPEDLKGGFASI